MNNEQIHHTTISIQKLYILAVHIINISKTTKTINQHLDKTNTDVEVETKYSSHENN